MINIRNRENTVSAVFLTAGLVSFVLAAFVFDPSARANDITVVGLFAGAVLFGMAGMFRPCEKVVPGDFIAFASGVIGFVMLVMVGFGWASSAVMTASLGLFMICAAGAYAKIGTSSI